MRCCCFDDEADGKVSLILNRDLAKSHDVEVVWEDAAPAVDFGKPLNRR